MPRVAVFDVDGTLSRGFYIVKFPEALYEEDLFLQEELIAIKEIFVEYKKGANYPYEQFAWDLVLAFGRGIKGQLKDDIEKIGEKYICLHPEEKFPFTDGLVEMVRNRGYITLIISGSPHEIILPFSRSLGIDKMFSTTYETDKGIFTGEVSQNCAVNKTKRQIVKRYMQYHNVDSQVSTGFGDSHHDLAFLELVGYPIAIKPDKKLEEIAMRNRWLICKDDEYVLNSVKLYLENIS